MLADAQPSRAGVAVPGHACRAAAARGARAPHIKAVLGRGPLGRCHILSNGAELQLHTYIYIYSPVRMPPTGRCALVRYQRTPFQPCTVSWHAWFGVSEPFSFLSCVASTHQIQTHSTPLLSTRACHSQGSTSDITVTTTQSQACKAWCSTRQRRCCSTHASHAR